jgi:hypothetical protein
MRERSGFSIRKSASIQVRSRAEKNGEGCGGGKLDASIGLGTRHDAQGRELERTMHHRKPVEGHSLGTLN